MYNEYLRTKKKKEYVLYAYSIKENINKFGFGFFSTRHERHESPRRRPREVRPPPVL